MPPPLRTPGRLPCCFSPRHKAVFLSPYRQEASVRAFCRFGESRERSVSLYPPCGGQISQGDDFFVLAVQHNLHRAVILRHELCHKLPAGLTGRHGLAVFLSIAITLRTASSPWVIMLKMALRSAQISNEHAVSTQTPTYILPDTDSTAAETPPASILSETSRGFNTCRTA